MNLFPYHISFKSRHIPTEDTIPLNFFLIYISDDYVDKKMAYKYFESFK